MPYENNNFIFLNINFFVVVFSLVLYIYMLIPAIEIIKRINHIELLYKYIYMKKKIID